jgi:hypothetical protein
VAGAGLGLLLCAWRADRHWFELHLTAWHCAQEPSQLADATRLRVLLAVAGVVVLLLARPAGRKAGTRPARELLGWVARIGLAVVLALAVSECALRRVTPKKDEPLHFEADPEPDPRYGWRPIPSHVSEVVVGSRTVRFAIDAAGDRVRSLDEPVDPARPTILLGGESVAAGFGLPYEETAAASVAERLGVQVADVAVSAVADDMATLRLVDNLPRFEHLLAAVTVVVPVTYDRNVWTDRPHVQPNDDGTFTLLPRGRPPLRLVTLFENITGYRTDEGLRRARAMLVASARASRARGVFPLFVLVSWPACLPDETGAPSIDRTTFEGLDLAHVRVDLETARFDALTYHPDALGQRRIADAIVAGLAAHGIPAH